VSGIDPIGVAVSALREWLVATLPARITTINTERAAVLRSKPGPFVIGANMHVRVATDRTAAGTSVLLDAGAAVTASTLATTFTTAAPAGLSYSADSDGRLVQTATSAPTTSAASCSVVLPDELDDATHDIGGNAALGWAAGGEYEERVALAAPTRGGVLDGWPSVPPDASQGFWVIIDDRAAKPWGGVSSLRKDEWGVELTLHLMKLEPRQALRRTREGITAATRAVKDVVLTTTGRYLGQPTAVVGLEVSGESIDGRGVLFAETPNVVHDVSTLNLVVRVFQQPTS